MKHKTVDGKTEYLVRWERKDIPDSWVLGEHFDGGSMADDYIRKHRIVAAEGEHTIATTDPEIVDSEGTGYQTRVATDLALNQDQLDLISCILLLTFRT